MNVADKLYPGGQAAVIAEVIDTHPIASATVTHFQNRDALHDQLSKELGAFHLSAQDAQVVVNAIAGGLNQPESARVRMDAAEENMRLLRQRYGDSASEALADMQRAIQRTPKLRDLLARSGAGNDLEVIHNLIAGTRRAKLHGR